MNEAVGKFSWGDGMIARRGTFVLAAGALLTALSPAAPGAPAVPEALRRRFAYLSKHGNSNCTDAFQKSIATMPPKARLQGSCCAPMVLDRYVSQVTALRKYRAFPEIPPDPYDIPAGLAQRAMRDYGRKLTGAATQAYAYAMAHAREHGPCCCRCWRWQAYGGLGKHLILRRGFTGGQVTEVWNLSDGCGGQD